MMRSRTVTAYLVFFIAAALTVFYSQNILAQNSNENDVLNRVNWQEGPSEASLDQWAEIHVPAGYVFANGPDTRILMEAMGNPASRQEVGFLSPQSMEWFVVFEFDKVGYVKDDEKDDLDTGAMLTSIKNGTESGNKVRREKGYPGLTILGWEIEPRYNEITHNLEWAVRAQDDEGQIILNHNTRILGRKGVMKATLVVAPELFDDVFPVYSSRLEDYRFKEGQKYAEFVQGDKIAKYGLTALIAGGAGAAAAKFGLFKFLGKFGKFILIGAAVFFAGIWSRIKRFFGGDNRTKRDMYER